MEVSEEWSGIRSTVTVVSVKTALSCIGKLEQKNLKLPLTVVSDIWKIQESCHRDVM